MAGLFAPGGCRKPLTMLFLAVRRHRHLAPFRNQRTFVMFQRLANFIIAAVATLLAVASQPSPSIHDT